MIVDGKDSAIQVDTKSKKRIPAIDIAKGLGIMLVVAGHMSEKSDFHTFIYAFHMPLFFILSGFVLKDSMGPVIKIGVKSKLLIEYFLWSAAYILYDFITKMLISGEYTLISIAGEIYMTIILYGMKTLWFLPAIIETKCYAILLLRRVKSKRLILMISILLFFAMSAIAPYINLLDVDKITYKIPRYFLISLFRPFSMLCFMLIGFYAGKPMIAILDKWMKKCWISLLPGSLLFFALTAFLSMLSSRVVDVHFIMLGNPFIFFFSAITGSLGTIILSWFLSGFSVAVKTVGLMGIYSVFIMATHVDLGIIGLSQTVIGFLFASFVSNQLIRAVAFLIAWMLAMAIEWILCRFVANRVDAVVRAVHKKYLSILTKCNV